jgi:hypothetical protein
MDLAAGKSKNGSPSETEIPPNLEFQEGSAPVELEMMLRRNENTRDMVLAQNLRAIWPQERPKRSQEWWQIGVSESLLQQRRRFLVRKVDVDGEMGFWWTNHGLQS